MFKIKNLARLSTFALACMIGSASAFDIAPVGTEGFKVIASNNDPVIASYLGTTAAYDNDLYLMLDSGGNSANDGDFSNDVFLFNNHATPVNTTFNLGSFTAGTELMFRLQVNSTGDHFYSGPASRNADGKPHARVQENWQPNTTLVSFEDLYDTPEHPGGYNDLSFSFTNTTVSPAPEPESMLLLAFGLGGIWLRRKAVRKAAKQS